MAILAELDPRCVIPNPRNPRLELSDLDDLIPSIKAVGLLQPIVVFPCTEPPGSQVDGQESTISDRPDGDLYMILIGHRRHAAVLHLGLPTILCLIAESETAAEQLVKILAEAGKSVDLTLLEEANAYHQLELLDWTPEQIATATARPLEKVQSALTIHRLPAQARTVAARVADSGDLDLEQIAALEEFAGDSKVMDRITKRAESGTWGFQHAIAEEKTKRERKQQLERVKAELTLAGVRIVPRPQAWGYGAREAEASTLKDTEGRLLDPDQVKARPGFAAFIDTQNLTAEPRVVIICVDPEAWGYVRTVRTSYVPDAKQAEADEEARRKTERKEALSTAATVRRTFLEQTYGTARTAKKAYLDALRDAVRNPETIRVDNAREGLAVGLAGADFEDASSAGMDRLTRMLVARWLSASEANLESCVLKRWNKQPIAARDYLDRLTTGGYTLSEAEQALYEDLLAEIKADADEDPDDDDLDADETDADTASADVGQSSSGDHDESPVTVSTSADESSAQSPTDEDAETDHSETDLNAVVELAASA